MTTEHMNVNMHMNIRMNMNMNMQMNMHMHMNMHNNIKTEKDRTNMIMNIERERDLRLERRGVWF